MVMMFRLWICRVLDDIKSTFQKKGDILYFFADRNQTVNLGMHSKAHTSVSVNPDPYPLCVPCHAFVSRNSIRALGFLHLPNFEHGYSDHYLGYIYKEVGQFHLHSGPKPFTVHNRPPPIKWTANTRFGMIFTKPKVCSPMQKAALRTTGIR